MFPSQIEFPKFVADQLLTSDDLNQLFGYLDEQNRMTRTNLVGIGIVCGLHLQWDTVKNEITITKGCGVTSEGYLIAVDTKLYAKYSKYVVDTPRVYEKFYKLDSGGKKVPMDIWELTERATEDVPDLLDDNFLTGKKILLFAEIKEEKNKNCDPNSCDDKGINVTVSFLPMVVSTADADLLMGASAGSFGINTYTQLPELRMRKWDVPNSLPVTTKDIFDQYFSILNKAFVADVKLKLSNIYTVFGSVVAGSYPDDPFKNFITKYEYLYNSNISFNQLLHLQYQYDLFSDLLLAYQEFRKAGTNVLSTCCPNQDAFPRHLMLGEAAPTVTTGQLPYRHYFIYSPLFDQRNLVPGLISLFNRLVLIKDKFFLPAISGNNTNDDTFLRVTPSMLWDVPLSTKAIPYYYQVKSGSQPLYLDWDHRRTLLNDAKRNLSYHADQYYNPADDFVLNPLQYDLEPYNFLRIEGIIGKSYRHVLKQVKSKVEKFRLPINVIALQTGDIDLELLLTVKQDCNLKDLELNYDIVRREWEAINGQAIEWLEDNQREARALIDQGHPNRFRNFIQQLHQGNNFMVDDLMDFMLQFTEFIMVYESLESEAEAIRLDLVNLLKNGKNIDKIFAEDLIDHIDDVTLSIKKGPFRTLQLEFKNRLTDIYSNLFFSYFTKKHPGIQHKAGVSLGGTFIIVYNGVRKKRRLTNDLKFRNEKIITRGMRTGNFVLAGEVVDENNKPIPGAAVHVRRTNQTVTTNNKGRFLLMISQIPAELEITAPGFIEVSKLFFNTDDNIEIKLQQDQQNIYDEIGDGIVIADFYLPYSCCSDCSPISFVIQDAPPEDISVDISDPVCDVEGENFTVTITIAGGTPPYKADGVEINGNATDITVESGKGKNVKIKDSGTKKVTAAIPVHTCVQPCNLPCEGESEKCNYILWFQKPDPNNDRNIFHRTEKAIITLTDQNGNKVEIDVTEIFKNELDKGPNDPITNATYDAVFESLFKNINTGIPPEFLGNNQPMFSYNSTLQIFSIERFTCQEVLMEIQLGLVNLEMRLNVRYDGQKAAIENVNEQAITSVPKFGCIRMNKCNGTSAPVCDQPIAINSINGQQEFFQSSSFIFSATPPAFDFYYWYFESGTPLQSEKKEPTITLFRQETPLVRLLVINNNGCFAIREERVALDFIIG